MLTMRGGGVLIMLLTVSGLFGEKKSAQHMVSTTNAKLFNGANFTQMTKIA